MGLEFRRSLPGGGEVKDLQTLMEVVLTERTSPK